MIVSNFCTYFCPSRPQDHITFQKSEFFKIWNKVWVIEDLYQIKYNFMITKFWFPYWVFHLNSFPVLSSDRIFPHCKWNADGLTTRRSTMNDKKLRYHPQVSFWAVKGHKFLFFLFVIPKRQRFHLIHSVLMDLKSRCNPPTTGALLTIPIERTQFGTAFGAKKLKQSKCVTSFIHFCTKQFSLAIQDIKAGRGSYPQ